MAVYSLMETARANETGTFTPALNTNAELNITYNYSHYYYETYKDKGIRAIYGITGLDSIPMLEKIAENIKEKYIVDGEWVMSRSTKKVYFDKAGKIYRKPLPPDRHPLFCGKSRNGRRGMN